MKKKDYNYKGFVIHLKWSKTEVSWTTEDVRTLQKYGESLKLTDVVDKPADFYFNMEISLLIWQQINRTIDGILAREKVLS